MRSRGDKRIAGHGAARPPGAGRGSFDSENLDGRRLVRGRRPTGGHAAIACPPPNPQTPPPYKCPGNTKCEKNMPFPEFQARFHPGAGYQSRMASALVDFCSSSECKEVWSSHHYPGQGPYQTCEPIYLRYGTVSESATDLTVSAPGYSWHQSRTYDTYTLGGGSFMGGVWLGVNNDQQLVKDGDDVSLYISGSASQKFTYDSQTETYTGPADNTLTLEAYEKDSVDCLMLANTVSGEVAIFYDMEAGAKAACYMNGPPATGWPMARPA